MSSNEIIEQDNIYYDICVSNLVTINQKPPILQFIETQNSPFISQCEDYYMSIIRFTIDMPTLPVFIPTIQPNQSNSNLTTYSVTLSVDVGGVTYTQEEFVIYSPQIQTLSTPLPPSKTSNGLQDNSTAYYQVYNYNWFIYLLNQTFYNCYNNLASQVTVGALPSTYAPQMIFNSSTNTFSLAIPDSGYNYFVGNTDVNDISIFFNPATFGLFFTLPFNLVYLNNSENIQIISFNQLTSQSYVGQYDTFDAYIINEEYSSISTWTPITSLVFTSQTLPVVSTNVSTPAIYINGSVFNQNGSSNVSNIVSDFVADSGNYRDSLEYLPSAQYRYLSLLGNKPVNTIDFQVFYKDRLGSLSPVYLGSGCTATIKVLFTRKYAMTKELNEKRRNDQGKTPTYRILS